MNDVAVHVSYHRNSGRISNVTTGPCRCDLNSETFSCQHPMPPLETVDDLRDYWFRVMDAESIDPS